VGPCRPPQPVRPVAAPVCEGGYQQEKARVWAWCRPAQRAVLACSRARTLHHPLSCPLQRHPPGDRAPDRTRNTPVALKSGARRLDGLQAAGLEAGGCSPTSDFSAKPEPGDLGATCGGGARAARPTPSIPADAGPGRFVKRLSPQHGHRALLESSKTLAIQRRSRDYLVVAIYGRRHPAGGRQNKSLGRLASRYRAGSGAPSPISTHVGGAGPEPGQGQRPQRTMAQGRRSFLVQLYAERTRPRRFRLSRRWPLAVGWRGGKNPILRAHPRTRSRRIAR